MDRLLTENIIYQGLKCLSISNNNTTIIATVSVGPCILFYETKTDKNLLKTINLSLKTPYNYQYIIYGGHRLWVAPEEYKTTYFPDDKPLNVSITDTKVTFEQNDFGQPFLKIISIQLEAGEVHISHTIKNLKPEKTECACWAITILESGGLATMPIENKPQDADGLQPTQQINLWQYTQPDNGFIKFKKEAIYVNAQLTNGHLKVGVPESTGKLTYTLNGQTLIKSFDNDYEAFFDKQSKAEIYCCPNYIELENIGKKHILKENETATFNEVWSFA